MEKRVHFYVSRKNVLTYLMALCLVGSAVTRIAIPCVKGTWDQLEVWSQIVLPVGATLLYVLIALISGKEMFYKTAIPVWLMGIFYAIQPHAILGSNPFLLGMYYICIVFFCALYTAISCGRFRAPWLLPLMFLLPIAAVGYAHNFWATTPQTDWIRQAMLQGLLPNYLLFIGCFLLSLGLKVSADGKYHPTWGDRSDGRKIRTLSPMAQITMYFQWERNICSNLFEEAVEISHIDRYIRQKRREGLTDFGIMHVLLAAYVRGVAKYPQLNRFISGQKVYSRGDDIQYCMVVKKEMTVDSPDTSIKVHLNPRDTAEDVYRKLNAAIDEVKATQELDSSLDGLIQYLNLIPGLFLKFVVWLLKLLDYFGLLPKFLLELSPFHGSLFFTSMGSLGIQPVYHHLYDFGNLPCFGAFGAKRKTLEVQEDGTVIQRKYVDIKFVLDERICDGFYYATFFKYYKRLLRNPEVLDLPPEEVVPDID
ncbi:MAG: hypothetical protein E7435_00560 [Ruminococcaceae bacterium]|nr:hypothetical protein [Oscillospiraceae bacterium]